MCIEHAVCSRVAHLCSLPGTTEGRGCKDEDITHHGTKNYGSYIGMWELTSNPSGKAVSHTCGPPLTCLENNHRITFQALRERKLLFESLTGPIPNKINKGSTPSEHTDQYGSTASRRGCHGTQLQHGTLMHLDDCKA